MGGDNSDLKSIVYYIVVPVAYANWDLQYGGSGSCDLAAFRLSHGQSWALGAYFDSDKLEVGGDNSNWSPLCTPSASPWPLPTGTRSTRTPARNLPRG